MVELHLLVTDLAEEVEEDEMLLLPELLGKDRLLHKKELDNLHIKPDLLPDLAHHRLLHSLPDFNVSARECVLVEPFVRLGQ